MGTSRPNLCYLLPYGIYVQFFVVLALAVAVALDPGRPIASSGGPKSEAFGTKPLVNGGYSCAGHIFCLAQRGQAFVTLQPDSGLKKLAWRRCRKVDSI